MSTALRTYYHGYDLVAMRDEQAAQSRYHHFDHQGTTQALTDATSAVTDRFSADAWGVQVRRTGTSINRQWYVGGRGYQRDLDTGRDYVRARYLEGVRARWISRDPIGGLFGLYGYAENRPVLTTDPTGLQVCGTQLCYEPPKGPCQSGRTLPCPKDPSNPQPGECNPMEELLKRLRLEKLQGCKLVKCGQPQCSQALATAQFRQLWDRFEQVRGGIATACSQQGNEQGGGQPILDPFHIWAVTICCEVAGQCTGTHACMECTNPQTGKPQGYPQQASCVQLCLNKHEAKHHIQCHQPYFRERANPGRIECPAWKEECECICGFLKLLVGRFAERCIECCRWPMDDRKQKLCDDFINELG